MDRDDIKAIFLMKFRSDHPKACAAERKRKRRANIRPEIECKFCGRVFQPTNGVNVFCSVSCQIAWHNRQKREATKRKPKQTKFCAECGKRFKTKDYRRKYCRPLCAYHALIRMTIERQRRKRNECKSNKINQ